MDNKNNKWTYAGYVASFLGGNVLAPLAGIVTKGLQDTDIVVNPNKVADYVRVGALAYATLDCIFGIGHTFHSGKEFWETTADVITMISLYTDMKGYAATQNPIKDTVKDITDKFQ